jgi:hypothetical protein
MTSIQTMHDVLFALAVTVGIAAAVTIALIAVGTLFGRDTVPATRPHSPAPSGPATETDDTRELVLR